MKQAVLAEPTLTDFYAARERIRRHLYPITPFQSRDLSSHLGREVWLIPECLQRTGSFKFRGALNRTLLLREECTTPVVTASSGNHAIGVTLAASIARLESTVFVPKGANEAKVAVLKGLGADVRFAGDVFDETEDLMYEYAAQNGLRIVNSFDADVIAGHGTAALDALDQVPDMATLVVPVASGGLLAGCAKVIRSLMPGSHLFGVQSTVWPVMYESLQAEGLVDVAGGETVADGLAGNSGRSILPFQIIQREVREILLVNEDAVLRGVRHGLVSEHLVLEGAGAAPIAAALDGLIPPGDGPVGLLLSGGNSTEAVIRKALGHS